MAATLHGYQSATTYHWAVQHRQNGALLGALGIFYTKGDAGGGAEGWHPAFCFGRAHWGNGYAAEALQAALAHFMRSTGTHTLYCCHATANPASGRVLQKAGFVYSHSGYYTGKGGALIPARHYTLHKAPTAATQKGQ